MIRRRTLHAQRVTVSPETSGTRGDVKRGLSILLLSLFPAFALADGTGTYSQQCAQCHGKKGEGMQYVAPALKGNEFVTQGSEEDIRGTIRNGRAGDTKRYTDDYPAAMPPVSVGQVSETELEELIAYLKGPLQE